MMRISISFEIITYMYHNADYVALFLIPAPLL